MTELDIWLGDELVARTVSLDRRRKTAIEYTELPGTDMRQANRSCRARSRSRQCGSQHADIPD